MMGQEYHEETSSRLRDASLISPVLTIFGRHKGVFLKTVIPMYQCENVHVWTDPDRDISLAFAISDHRVRHQ